MFLSSDTYVNSWKKISSAASWSKGVAEGEAYQSSPEKIMKSHCAHNSKIHL